LSISIICPPAAGGWTAACSGAPAGSFLQARVPKRAAAQTAAVMNNRMSFFTRSSFSFSLLNIECYFKLTARFVNSSFHVMALFPCHPATLS
jgi:hypothetical protein